MNARYLGKKIQKNEFGDIIYKSIPCVEVNMEETEVDRFHRIMKWISDNFFHYIYDVYGYVGGYTSYVQVQDMLDGAEFLSVYKDAKEEIQ